jgi:hypothetical protein
MNLPEMPELPDLDVNLDSEAAKELAATARCHNAFVCSYGCGGDLHLWTAEKMTVYGKLCLERGYKMGREDAAKVCESMRTRPPAECDDVERGFNAALGRVAAAIRGEKR